MEAGKLRHRITIQYDAGTALDDSRQPVPDWRLHKEVSAEVVPVAGGERFRGNQMQADTTHFISIRYLSGVTPKMRAMFKGRELNFLSVLNVDERNIELRIQAKERV